MFSVLPLLFIVASAEPALKGDEIRERWSLLRQSLHPVHIEQQEKAGHKVSTLNVTAADHAMHKTKTKYNQIVKDRVEAPYLVAYANSTRAKPLTIPVAEIGHNLFRAPAQPLVAIPTMVPEQSGPLPLRTADKLRPLDEYCSNNECTNLGEVSRTIGRRIQNMYHGSAPGRLQDRMSASATGALYSTTRGLIPHELTRIARPPEMDGAIESAKQLVQSLNFDPERPMRKTSERLTRTLVWDNLELIGPASPERRMANNLAYVHARDMVICRLSANTLPYCRKPLIQQIDMDNDDQGNSFEEEAYEGDQENRSREEAEKDGTHDLTKLITEESFIALEPDLLRGFAITGVAKSCLLQGGCFKAGGMKPDIFDRDYVDDHFIVGQPNLEIDSTAEKITTEDEDAFKPDIAGKLFQNLASKGLWAEDITPKGIQQWPVYLKIDDRRVRLPVRADGMWLSGGRRARYFDFDALVLPKYDNLTKVVEEKLPFLYLIPGGNIPVTQPLIEANHTQFAPLAPANWNKPWLDWRIAYPSKNENNCIGPYDWEAKLCVTPLALIMRPIFND